MIETLRIHRLIPDDSYYDMGKDRGNLMQVLKNANPLVVRDDIIRWQMIGQNQDVNAMTPIKQVRAIFKAWIHEEENPELHSQTYHQAARGYEKTVNRALYKDDDRSSELIRLIETQMASRSVKGDNIDYFLNLIKEALDEKRKYWRASHSLISNVLNANKIGTLALQSKQIFPPAAFVAALGDINVSSIDVEGAPWKGDGYVYKIGKSIVKI